MVKVPPWAPLITIFPSSMMIGVSYLNDQIESSPTRGVTNWIYSPNKVIKPETRFRSPKSTRSIKSIQNNLFYYFILKCSNKKTNRISVNFLLDKSYCN